MIMQTPSLADSRPSVLGYLRTLARRANIVFGTSARADDDVWCFAVNKVPTCEKSIRLRAVDEFLPNVWEGTDMCSELGRS